MTALPVWFGPPDRLLFGWFHTPESARARGGVVICAPLGRDYLLSHYALRRYAVRFEQMGFCVVRFDYDGTGDSVGTSTDPDRVSSWLSGISQAVGLLRDAGIRWVALAGMRSGALLAAAAAETDGSIDALVLIDPIQSGRSFVSEQRAVAAMSLGVHARRDDGSVETPGVVYDAANGRRPEEASNRNRGRVACQKRARPHTVAERASKKGSPDAWVKIRSNGAR